MSNKQPKRPRDATLPLPLGTLCILCLDFYEQGKMVGDINETRNDLFERVVAGLQRNGLHKEAEAAIYTYYQLPHKKMWPGFGGGNANN